MFKNMKIEVNGDLDEIVVELERLGFSKRNFSDNINPTCSIRTFEHELYHHIKQFEFLAWNVNAIDDFWNLATLAELKQMESVELKEM